MLTFSETFLCPFCLLSTLIWLPLDLYSQVIIFPLYLFMLQLALEQHGFELLWSTYKQISFNEYRQLFRLYWRFHIRGFNKLNCRLETVFSDFQLQIPNFEFRIADGKYWFDMWLLESADTKDQW